MALFSTYEDAYRMNVIQEAGATADGVTNDSLAVNNAFATGASHVFFPPGTYLLTASTTSSVADQIITFAPGAKLKLNGGSIAFTGARQRIRGLWAWLSAASNTTFDAVKFSGASTVVEGCRVDIDDDNPNCTLVKINGPRTYMSNLKLTSLGKSFKYGLHVVSTDGSESLAKYVTVQGIDADVGDDGADVTFQALLYLRGSAGVYRELTIQTGGRALFPNGVVVVDSHFNAIDNPQILAPAAQYGINLMDGAEFCYIRGGWIQAVAGGGWLANSEGVRIGHNCDHFSSHDVSLTGWDFGIGFHGSNNIPQLIGTDTSNNQTAGILFDTNIAGTDWPVSSLAMVGCYGENAAADSQPAYIWAKTGLVIGAVLSGCQIGYETNAIKIENAGFGGASIQGCRIIAKDETGVIIGANSTTDVFFGKNDIERSNTISTGPDAAKVRTAVDSSTTSMALFSLTLGVGGSPITGRFKQINTANFGEGIPANDMVELPFSFSGAAVTDVLNWSVTGPLAANPALSFFCYIDSAGHLTLRARNHTASPIGPISGSLISEIVK